VKKQSEGIKSRGLGFETPRKGKTFKQAKLAVSGSGNKLNIYQDYNQNAYSNASVATAPTTHAKRGRPQRQQQSAEKVKFPRKSKRKAKVNASSVIKQLYSNSKIRSASRKQRMVVDDMLFYL